MAAMLKREAMAYAQFLAGMAFNNASLGYVRDGAPAGRFHNLPHGVCNAVLLPHRSGVQQPRCASA